jgi:hypothetical protein
MRIYLDSNVFRDLKKPENSALYDDEDMIKKTSLIYNMLGIDTEVVKMTDFYKYLIEAEKKDISVGALFEQFAHAAELPTTFERHSLDEFFIMKELPEWYLGEFNSLTCASTRGHTYFYFSQDFRKISSSVLTVELERVENRLVAHFGSDELGWGSFDRKELGNGDWKGRQWRVGEMGVLLRLDKGITISFFGAAPPADGVG